MPKWAINDYVPGARRNAKTQESINEIASIPLGKSARVPADDVANARTAIKYYEEDCPQFVVKTQK